jgi:cell cycle checkpoint protein
VYILATAYVFSSIFDEYTYTAPPDSRPTTPNADEPTFGPQAQSTTFELPLNALVDCLNIFGTASVAATSNASLKRTRAEEAEVGGGGGGGRGRGGGKRGGDTDDEGQSKIHQYFGGEKGTTGLRMRYVGPGYPLTLSM